MGQAQADSAGADADKDQPLFDVVVKIPPNTTLEDVDARARAAGIAPERVDALMKALRNLPQVRIGSSVPRARADAAREQFGKAGLIVVVTPLLGLQAKMETPTDGKTECPACEQRVLLGPHRQCPECGVYVDKVTQEDILRRKLLRQEKAKLDFQLQRDAEAAEKKTREALEAALREKIREELEEEYGLKERRRHVLASPPVIAVAALVLAGSAFVGGRGSTGAWPWAQAQTQPAGPATAGRADPDKLLESLGPAGGAGGSAGTATGDPDIDDPLIRQAGGERIGAKGLSVEQAVAAAQVLGKSVGNTAGQRVPGSGAAAGTTATEEAGAASAPPAAVPPAVKNALALELVRQMAETGQWARAQAMLKVLRASPRINAEPATANAAQALEVEVRAWALQGVAPAQVRDAADALLTQARGLPGRPGQAQALGLAGGIVSHHVALPPEVPRAFLHHAADAARGIAEEPERVRVTSELSLAVGQSLLAETTRAARAGAWARTQALAAQFEGLLAQVSDPAVQARLLAMDANMKSQLGKAELAGQSLARSLQQVAQVPELPQRAILLRQVARLANARAAAPVVEAAAALQALAEARTGVERARTLTELALLHAQAGAEQKAEETGAAATATAGLTEPDLVLVRTHLLVRGDLTTARLLHEAGRYAEAEVVLRRLGDYLL